MGIIGIKIQYKTSEKIDHASIIKKKLPVQVKEKQREFAEGEISGVDAANKVYIDLGKKDGVAVGDKFIVYREGILKSDAKDNREPEIFQETKEKLKEKTKES